MARRRLPILVVALAIAVPACKAGDDRGDRPAAGAVSTLATAATSATGAIEGPDGDAAAPADTAVAATDPATSAPPSTTATTVATTLATTTSAPTTVPATTTTTTVPGAVPVVDAAAYTVLDMRSGEFLARKDADTRRAVGSLMKLLTAQVAYDAGQPTKIVTAPAEGLVLFPGDESLINIEGGQELSRDLLVRAMLKASANDAARLLALDIAGSEAAFAELMNAAAAAHGLDDTHAVNATGLDAEGQYSSARDMTVLGARLMGSINFQVAVRDDAAELNGQAYPNTNDLLGVYPGADGIKTGHTTGAGWCILASAIRDGRRIVVAVLGAPSEEARNASAAALLDWAFAQPARP